MTLQPVDWHAYFQTPLIAWFNIATQDPTRGLLCHNGTGLYQLYAWNRLDNTLRQLTFSPNGTQLGAISADGRSVYYLEDAQGGQIGHFFRVGFDGTDAQDLTADWIPYTSFYITESYSGAFYGFMIANQMGFQMFVVDTKSGAMPHLRYESEAFSVGPFLSHNGELAVIANTDQEPDTLDFALESYDIKSGQRLHTLWRGTGSSVQPIGFINRAHDMRFLVVTRQGEWHRPLIWNARTSEITDLPFADLLGDLTPLDWSSDGETLLIARLHAGRQSLHRYSIKSRTLHTLTWSKDWHITHAHLEGDSVVALAQNLYTPPLLLRDGQPILALQPAIHADVRYIKQLRTDGVVTSAWGTVPKSPSPLVVYVHGGPHEVFSNQYHAPMWAWDSLNYGFLSVNYRGSASFGKTPEESLIGQLSQLEVEDIVRFVQEEQQVANTPYTPEKTLIMGASYGGYLALMAILRHPERFMGAIIVTGIADWQAFYEQAHPEQQAYIAHLMGGTPDTHASRYAQASPLSLAQHLTRPLLIIQGKDDPQIPSAQMHALVEQWQAQGKAVTLIEYDQETPNLAWQIQVWAMGWAQDLFKDPIE